MAEKESVVTDRCIICGRKLKRLQRCFIGSRGFSCSRDCMEFGDYYSQVPDPYEAAVGEIRRCSVCGIRFSYWPWEGTPRDRCHGMCGRKVVNKYVRTRG